MPVIPINLDLGNRNLQIALDLDECHSNEKIIISYLCNGHFYEPDVSLALTRLVGEGDAVVDIGANAGFFTIVMGVLAGPSGRVLSIEPDAHNLSRLRNNISLNQFRHVTVFERPVTDKEGEVTFFINSDNSGGNALWDPAHYPGNQKSHANPIARTMAATTLERVVADTGLAPPKLIKIDTEGAEQRILEGAGGLIRNRAVPFVIAELHEFGLHQMGCSQASLRALMEANGYSTFLLYPNGALPKLIPPGTMIRTHCFVNLLFSTIEKVGAHWQEEPYELKL